MTTYADFDDLEISNFVKSNFAETGVEPKGGSYYMRGTPDADCFAYYPESFQDEPLTISLNSFWFYTSSMPLGPIYITHLTNIRDDEGPLTYANVYGIYITADGVYMMTSTILGGSKTKDVDVQNITEQTGADISGAWYRLEVRATVSVTIISLYDSDNTLIVSHEFEPLYNGEGVNGFYAHVSEDVQNLLIDESVVNNTTEPE